MFGLWRLKEPIQRCAKCRRTLRPVVRNPYAGTPLRRGDQEVCAVEANSEIHCKAIRRSEFVLDIKGPLIPIRTAREPERLVAGEFAGVLADVSSLRRLCISDREAEILPERQSRRFESKFQRVTISLVRETTQDAD